MMSSLIADEAAAYLRWLDYLRALEDNGYIEIVDIVDGRFRVADGYEDHVAGLLERWLS